MVGVTWASTSWYCYIVIVDGYLVRYLILLGYEGVGAISLGL